MLAGPGGLGVSNALGLNSLPLMGRNERIWSCYPGQMVAVQPFEADKSSPEAPPRTSDSQDG